MTEELSHSKIGALGFLGAGKMASALISAILKSKLADSRNIICSDILEPQRKTIQEKYGIQVTDDNQEVIRKSDIIVLAFKPQNFSTAVDNYGCTVGPEQIIISIMAGVRIEEIQKQLPAKVVRVMPNTACLVGEMAAGFAAAENVTPQDLEKVKQILQCAGTALPVTEDQLDAVTGLSGSGPAFVAYLIDNFIEAGRQLGLDKDIARELALKTFSGTARLLSEWQMDPAELIKMVSSPNGTTVAGREILEASDVGNIIRQTIHRAAQRSKELGKQ